VIQRGAARHPLTLAHGAGLPTTTPVLMGKPRGVTACEPFRGRRTRFDTEKSRWCSPTIKSTLIADGIAVVPIRTHLHLRQADEYGGVVAVELRFMLASCSRVSGRPASAASCCRGRRPGDPVVSDVETYKSCIYLSKRALGQISIEDRPPILMREQRTNHPKPTVQQAIAQLLLERCTPL